MGEDRRISDEQHPVTAFWRKLDEMRRERGVSYQRLENKTGIPGSTLQYWVTRSRRLPAWPQVRAVVRALRESEEIWFDRWKRVDRELEALRIDGRGLSEPADRDAAGYPPVVARSQLPMDIVEFTGRQRELSQLHDLLAPSDHSDATAVVISAIEGMAGVGKTRLAVHLAHQLKHAFQFDEIQLYADLHAHTPGQRPTDPATVLEAFLRLLGVPGSEIPLDTQARAALYRDRLDGTRAIVLLDNVATEEQVRPLLPGSPACRVLITSRRSLAGLDGAWSLPLSVFEPADAMALLARVVGRERLDAELEEAAEIVRLCGHLPLAVVLAARRLRARPAWTLADLRTLLEAEERRLGTLQVGDRAVRAMFALSYEHLTPEQQRMFRLLGLHPGYDFSAASAAAIADTTLERAQALLETLLDEHLLEQRTCGHYRFHDLLHVYAKERTKGEDDAHEREAAIRRVLNWYLYTADNADRVIAPLRRHVPLTAESAPPSILTFASHRDALNWCEIERANLIAATRTAAAHNHNGIAWRIPTALYGFVILRKHWHEWLLVHQDALTAARCIGDRFAEGWVLNGFGIAYTELQRYPEAIDCFHTALNLRRQVDDRIGESETLNNLGETYRRLGQLTEAIENYQKDLAICREIGDRHGESISLNNLGKARYDTGQYVAAIKCHSSALMICRESADRYSEAEIRNDLGDTYRALERFDSALDHYTDNLRRIYELLAQYPDAARCDEEAQAIRRDIGRSAAGVSR
jgi:tetratricopeptide (TPR) repeat protein